jgi:hypothetical protein
MTPRESTLYPTVPDARDQSVDRPGLVVFGAMNLDAAPPAVSAKRSSWLAEHDLSVVDAVAALIALLLCVAYGSFFLVPGWTPRVAVVLISLPMGLVVLALQAARRDAIAVVCTTLVATAVVAGLLSENARSAIVGTVGNDASALILAGSVGLLAIGRELSEQGRRAVGWAVVAGVSLSSAVGSSTWRRPRRVSSRSTRSERRV